MHDQANNSRCCVSHEVLRNIRHTPLLSPCSKYISPFSPIPSSPACGLNLYSMYVPRQPTLSQSSCRQNPTLCMAHPILELSPPTPTWVEVHGANSARVCDAECVFLHRAFLYREPSRGKNLIQVAWRSCLHASPRHPIESIPQAHSTAPLLYVIPQTLFSHISRCTPGQSSSPDWNCTVIIIILLTTIITRPLLI
jgi:hypothetical protein